MPWDVKQDDRCPASKPWAVINGDNNRLVACHVTKDSATQQQKALYANVQDRVARADADEDPKKLLAGLDAILDEAIALTKDVDRSTLPPEVGQALDLLVGAEEGMDALMQQFGVYDPDEATDDDERTLLDLVLDRKFLIHFDYRSDGGPMLVGDFPTRDAAVEYVHALEPFEAEWEVWPITPPHVRI